jgi:hypothetical protein
MAENNRPRGEIAGKSRLESSEVSQSPLPAKDDVVIVLIGTLPFWSWMHRRQVASCATRAGERVTQKSPARSPPGLAIIISRLRFLTRVVLQIKHDATDTPRRDPLLDSSVWNPFPTVEASDRLVSFPQFAARYRPPHCDQPF